MGVVTMDSPVGDKLAFYADLFRARTDVYAVRWENPGPASGWMPAVTGGWRKGMDRRGPHLPLRAEVVAAHLVGDVFIGLLPLLRDNTCHFLVADFDGPAAMLDALAYIKAARASGVPAALEISQSGRGAHVWVFFTGAVPAPAARVGTALVHEAMVLRGSMDLRSYDRLFPNQDVLPEGGFGNLIAAPLHGRRRKDGLTVFLDLATLEPYEDQWAFLSTLDRLSPGDAERVARRAKRAVVGTEVATMSRSDATRVHPPLPAGCSRGARRRAEPGLSATHCGRAVDVQARGLHGQPEVLRTAAPAQVHLGHPSVRPGLRHHPRRSPGPSSRTTPPRRRTSSSGPDRAWPSPT